MRLFSYKTDNDISIILKIYSSRREPIPNTSTTTKRKFTLRQLSGSTETEQIEHARQIMDDVAKEIHYLTSFGVDHGIIKVGGKKVFEIAYPDLSPRLEEFIYFFDGVLFQFNVAHYLWVKDDKKQQVIKQSEINDGWQLEPVELFKIASFRLPCVAIPSHQKQLSDRGE